MSLTTADILTLTLPYPPSLNKLYRTVNGRPILSAEGRAFKDRTAMLAIQTGAKPLDGDVVVSLRFYRPAKRIDTDNLLKCSLDALKGVAFHDDAQVKRIEAERFDTDKDNPRVEVEARQATASSVRKASPADPSPLFAGGPTR